MNNAPLARLGRFAHAHKWSVVAAWAAIAIGLGFLAPKLESALSGAMWEVNGSDSLAARQLIERNFGGFSSQSGVIVLHSDTLTAQDAAFQDRIAKATAVLASDKGYTPVAPAQVSPDGHTVMLQAGSTVDPTEAVRAAERIGGDVEKLDGNGMTVALTGSPAFWADFNALNKESMMKSEMI